jgi:hypothetical protein
MVRKLPGTDVDLSSRGFSELQERGREKYGVCFVLLMCLLTPILVGVMLGALTLIIAACVFAIQALVVGVATYQDPLNTCQWTVGYWMVVFGSLYFASCGLQCLCSAGGRDSADAEGHESNPSTLCSCISGCISLANLGWLSYGVYLVYNQSETLIKCNPAQYQTFNLMVMFLFWGFVAAMSTALFLLCCVLPCVSVLELAAQNGDGAGAGGGGGAPATASATGSAQPVEQPAEPAVGVTKTNADDVMAQV